MRELHGIPDDQLEYRTSNRKRVKAPPAPPAIDVTKRRVKRKVKEQVTYLLLSGKQNTDIIQNKTPMLFYWSFLSTLWLIVPVLLSWNDVELHSVI